MQHEPRERPDVIPTFSSFNETPDGTKLRIFLETFRKHNARFPPSVFTEQPRAEERHRSESGASMVKFVSGNLFDSKAPVWVNAVNGQGVMGAGIAIEFKKRFPAMFEDYKARCKRGEIHLGVVTHFVEGERTIVNVPTKFHWRDDSTVEGVERGVKALVVEARRHGWKHIALCALGCGLGGIPWVDMRGVLRDQLLQLEDAEIEIYEPYAGR